MGERYAFTVNGILRETEVEKPLLQYLRDDLRLMSVKDGCSEGACGTCTIVVDGKAVKTGWEGTNYGFRTDAAYTGNELAQGTECKMARP